MSLRLVPGIPVFGHNGQQTKSTRDIVRDTATFGGEQDRYGRVLQAEPAGGTFLNLERKWNESTRPPDREWR